MKVTTIDAIATVIGRSIAWGLIFAALATITMPILHYGITSWQEIVGNEPGFSWGLCWLCGLFPPMLPISIIVAIASVIAGAFL